jgi:hypothetical protein
MERLKELITQLKEQFDRKAEPAQLLQTAQLLEAEIRLLACQPAAGRVVPTKIAVMMPSATKIVPVPSPEPSLGLEPILNGVAAAGPMSTSPMPTSPMSTTPMPTSPLPTNPIPNGVAAVAPVFNGTPAASRTKESERGTWPFDPLAEKPTDRFTLSQKSREINDVIGTGNGTSSLNEKLKSDVVELKSALNDTPVRDLKKAIGVNDRYVFISQLFRGDEVMYERSLKTINGFRILPEAEYWMERELKVKLGWDENREATRHFYQLVKRRFS